MQQIKRIKVTEETGCSACPFRKMETWDPSKGLDAPDWEIICRVSHSGEKWGKTITDGKGIRMGKVEVPHWCPLRENNILVTLGDK